MGRPRRLLMLALAILIAFFVIYPGKSRHEQEPVPAKATEFQHDVVWPPPPASRCSRDQLDRVPRDAKLSLGTTSVLSDRDEGACLPYEARRGQVKPLRSLGGLAGRKLMLQPLEEDDAFDWSTVTGRKEPRILRQAVVLRAYKGFKFTADYMTWLQVFLSELEADKSQMFEPVLLYDLKDDDHDLSDAEVYRDALSKNVPAELHHVTVLFNKSLLRGWYPKAGEYQAKNQLYQPLQIFSFSFPEFDAIWQMEMDARFTENVATIFTTAGQWAQQQSRRNLWERNGRFYMPKLFNDCYADFSAQVDSEIGINGIWGAPENASLFVTPRIRAPPRDQHLWGVGEDADLISFSPLIDPSPLWTFYDEVHNFPQVENVALPRRQGNIAIRRVSRRLLRIMSDEQKATGAWMVPESMPETFAYLHGLKAVALPHYISFHNLHADTDLDAMVHKGPPSNRAGGREASALWLKDNKKGRFADPRWLTASYFWWGAEAERLWKSYVAGKCVPPMLLHPVKT